VHAARRQGTAVAAMMACVGPHWQAASVAAQPAAEMAEARQEVCGGEELAGAWWWRGGGGTYSASGLAGEVLGEDADGEEGEDGGGLHFERMFRDSV
jgi:hypothetical protein